MIYYNNSGAMEIANFYITASYHELKEFDEYLIANDEKSAWLLIQTVLRVKLVGDDFGTEEELKKFKDSRANR